MNCSIESWTKHPAEACAVLVTKDMMYSRHTITKYKADPDPANLLDQVSAISLQAYLPFGDFLADPACDMVLVVHTFLCADTVALYCCSCIWLWTSMLHKIRPEARI